MRFAALKKPPLISLLVLQLSLSIGAAIAQTDFAVEKRVVDYLKQNVTPGKPLVVSELYNSVFTAPEERKALDRLFNVFFKIPIFVAQHKAGTNRIPTLADISRQFNLQVPGEVPVLLTILESDPRIPKFMSRDARTGEITSVDIEAVKKDKRFSQAIERTIGGWVGQECPRLHSGFAEWNDAELVKPRRQKLLAVLLVLRLSSLSPAFAASCRDRKAVRWEKLYDRCRKCGPPSGTWNNRRGAHGVCQEDSDSGFPSLT